MSPEKPASLSASPRAGEEVARAFDEAPVALYTVDLSGIIVQANQEALQLLGYRREAFVGRPVREFHVDPAAADDLLARLCRGETVRDYPAQMRLHGGAVRDMVVCANPHLEAGAMVEGRCFIRDNTGTLQAQEAARLLAGIVSASDDAIVSKSLDGIIRSWNRGAERLFGYSAAEAVGQPITLIIPPELHDEERDILARLARGERIDHFETVRVAKDGRRLDISLTVSPVRDDTGRITGASKIGRDITERKRVEEALREADRRKDEFLAMLAHELRNPLAPIRNALDVLERTDDRDIQLRTQATMKRQLSHLVRLVDDLLDVGRISRDKLELRKERVALSVVLDRAIEISQHQCHKSGMTIELEVPKEPIYVDADLVRLTQVFSNLIDNACKYTPDPSLLRISAQRQSEQVAVSIKDRGIGIPRDQLEHIFDLFAQVDRRTERARGGLGIGLTLVKRLVGLHGGTVEARSEGPNHGTEMIVHLPVAAAPADGPVAPAATPRPDVAVGTTRILVVDDNHDSAETLAALLELHGHDTCLAFDGPSALDVAQQLRPDVILLDIGLPGLSGHEVCRRLREQSWGRQLAIVALTGWGQDSDRQQSRNAGFDGHLVKPVGQGELLELLTDLLADRNR